MDTGNWEREPFCLDGNARRNLPQEAGSGIISTEFVPGDLLPGEFMRRRNNEGRIMRFMAPDPDKPDHVICAWAERGPDRQIVQRSFPISELGRYRFAGVIRIRT